MSAPALARAPPPSEPLPARKPPRRWPRATWATEEAIAWLRSAWLDGVPTAAIGRRLGVSKGAVIGMADRLGLPPHASIRAPPMRES